MSGNSPKSKCFQSFEQDNIFAEYANNIILGKYDYTDVVIMNRSHYGEYVYGQIYRKRSGANIMKMINKVDNILENRKDLKIKYIQLLSTSTELRKRNDDNKSLSLLDEQKMEQENKLFLDIYDYSNFDKKIIYVNKNDSFRPKQDILNEAIDFLNK